MDYSPWGFFVHGVLQARILEWVAISFSRGSSQPRDRTWHLLHCRWILYHWAAEKFPYLKIIISFLTPPLDTILPEEWDCVFLSYSSGAAMGSGTEWALRRYLSHVWIKPGMLQPMGLQGVGHDQATEQQQQWVKAVIWPWYIVPHLFLVIFLHCVVHVQDYFVAKVWVPLSLWNLPVELL